MKTQNVSIVAQLKLCNSCGGCQWICPVNAITYIESMGGYLLPQIDEDKCNHCKMCISICPGVSFGQSLTSKLPEDPFIGTISNAYICKATDQKFYANSQSGGAVTALINAAIQRKEIAGALTVAMPDGGRLHPYGWLSKSTDDLIKSQKSKYCPVPSLSALDHLKNSPTPIGLVCLPCQLHGLWNILDRFPEFVPKVAFTIGLVCDRIMTYAAIDFLIYKANRKRAEIDSITYREKKCGGYPGRVLLKCKDGSAITMASKNRTQIKEYFTPVRCRLCFDKLNVFADIVVGDPWGISEADRRNGESLVLVRTDKGRHLFENALKDQHLQSREIDYMEAVRGQAIEQKRTDWANNVHAWKSLHSTCPNYVNNILNDSLYTVKHKRKYVKSMTYSIKVDEFSSRAELLHSVTVRLTIKKIFKILNLPFRALNYLIRKVKRQRIYRKTILSK